MGNRADDGGVFAADFTHELKGAPIMAGMVASKFSDMGTGGWSWILSDLKSVSRQESSM